MGVTKYMRRSQLYSSFVFRAHPAAQTAMWETINENDIKAPDILQLSDSL